MSVLVGDSETPPRTQFTSWGGRLTQCSSCDEWTFSFQDMRHSVNYRLNDRRELEASHIDLHVKTCKGEKHL